MLYAVFVANIIHGSHPHDPVHACASMDEQTTLLTQSIAFVASDCLINRIICRGVEPTGSKTVEALHKLAGDKIHIRIVVRNATQAKPEWKKWGCEVSS
jgi:hypothetical protein